MVRQTLRVCHQLGATLETTHVRGQAAVQDEGPEGRSLPIALVCPERRLRLVLRLALEGAGYDVRDWSSAPSERQGSDVVAAVVDLDS
jgi:hypothetical protein